MPKSRFWQASGPRVVAVAGGHESAIVRALVEGGHVHADARLQPGLGERVGRLVRGAASALDGMPAEARDEGWAPDVPDWAEGGERTPHGYTLIENIALMSVDGPLMARGFQGWWSGCYWPGYRDYIAALEAAAEDDRVEGIQVLFDTPGGFVSGLIESARAWRGLNAAAGGKPIIAHVGELCCSAGMALAAQCDAIFASDGATVGSVGARLVIFDMSAAMERWGEAVHVFKSGELKDMGAWWRAPTDREAAQFQMEIDHCADRFFVELAAGRGLDLAAIRDHRGWDAQTFTAGDPPPPAEIDPMREDVGLIDGVMNEEAAYHALKARIGTASPLSTGGAIGRASQNPETQAAGSIEEEPTMAKLTGRLTALMGKKNAGTLSKEEETELAQAAAMLAAMNGDEDEDAGDEEDDAEAAGGDDDEEAADEEDDAEAAGSDDEEEAADEEDDAEASANAVLKSKAAQSRPSLAGSLATKVALGKMTKADAMDILTAAAPEGSGFKASALANTPDGLKPAPVGGKGGDEAKTSLSAAMKRLNRNT